MVWLLTVIAASISQYVRFRQISCEEINDLKEENCRLYAELKKKYEMRHTVISRSESMKKIYQQLGMVVTTRATVLLLGESGVGKECLANDIHYTSPRVDKPFVKVNCAAIPPNLVESMLFGHEKGSFTGAHARHQGYFEQADGGTIFLDEIGELPLSLQSKFLRVLQERQFERVGGKETLSVDVRVIAATNRDLKQMVAAGKFREDLFYRVNVFPIRIPALRERKIDIMDKIINFIDEARFVIADFTCIPEEQSDSGRPKCGVRGGVYYEAGYAKGLKLEVIHTCCINSQPRMHFDIQQKNTIFWKKEADGKITTNGQDYIEYLKQHIWATIGKKA